jgi:hypothetical protein
MWMLFPFLIGIFILNACRKVELNSGYASENFKNISSKFFNVPANTHPTVKRIAAALKNLSEKHDIGISKFSKKYGYPVWDKAPIIIGQTRSRVFGRGQGGGLTADTLVMLPVADDSIGRVQSFLACDVKADSITIRIFNADEYSAYGKTNNIDTLSSETVASVSMYLEYLVNDGRDSFRLKDQELFYDSVNLGGPTQMVVVDTISNSGGLGGRGRGSNQNRGSYIVMPQYWNACFNLRRHGSAQRARGQSMSSEVFCIEVTEWVELIEELPGIIILNQGETGGGGNSGQELLQSVCTSDPSIVCQWVTGIGWVPILPGGMDDQGYLYTKIDTLSALLAADPDYLINPCEHLDAFYALGVFQAPSSVTNRIDSLNNAYIHSGHPQVYRNFLETPFYVQNINNASGTIVNCDYFPVHISVLPTLNGTQMTVPQLMEYFRLNMNSFVDNSIATFEGYNDGWFLNDVSRWNSSNPLGALVHLNMLDNGTVIVAQNYSNSDNAGFLVKTLRSPLDVDHPVSGNRTWKIDPDPVNGGFTFYTRAVDRVTGFFPNLVNNMFVHFSVPDDLWESMQTKMANFINTHGGSATVGSSFIARPRWSVVKDFLKGNKTLAQLRAAYGC